MVYNSRFRSCVSVCLFICLSWPLWALLAAWRLDIQRCLNLWGSRVGICFLLCFAFASNLLGAAVVSFASGLKVRYPAMLCNLWRSRVGICFLLWFAFASNLLGAAVVSFASGLKVRYPAMPYNGWGSRVECWKWIAGLALNWAWEGLRHFRLFNG